MSVESDAKMSKCRTLIMLISPTLVLAIIPIFLSFIIKKLILMTFLVFFGFSSLAMSVSDIYFFIVILLKMRNNELFYQEDNKIYIFKKWSFLGCCSVQQPFFSVPGMALIQSEINWPRAFTAKCSKPQAVIREDMSEGSGVAILLSVRIETWYKAKWWVRLLNKLKPKR